MSPQLKNFSNQIIGTKNAWLNMNIVSRKKVYRSIRGLTMTLHIELSLHELLKSLYAFSFKNMSNGI